MRVQPSRVQHSPNQLSLVAKLSHALDSMLSTAFFGIAGMRITCYSFCCLAISEASPTTLALCFRMRSKSRKSPLLESRCWISKYLKVPSLQSLANFPSGRISSSMDQSSLCLAATVRMCYQAGLSVVALGYGGGLAVWPSTRHLVLNL